MAESIEIEDQFGQLLPVEDEPLDADESFNALEALEEFPTSPDVTLETEEPPPLGRSWAFDFAAGKFIMGGGRGPLETRGIATLRTWIEKAIRTERGAHAIYPDDYGVERLYDLIAGPMDDFPTGELQRRLTDAILFHPRVADVGDWRIEREPMNDYVIVHFVVETEDSVQLEFTNVGVTRG